MSGLFIVFEGIDGSGTSTQSKILCDYINKKGYKCHLTSEPSPGPIGTLIRNGMNGRVQFSKGKNPLSLDSDLFDEQMAYLFAADRHDHLYNPVDGIIKMVKNGDIVISSRYFFSSFAYHCSSEEDYDFVEKINSKFPSPDLVIYMDNQVHVSIDRINARAVRDEYENKGKLDIVRYNYNNFFKNYDGDVLYIDASRDINDIKNLIITKVDGMLK